MPEEVVLNCYDKEKKKLRRIDATAEGEIKSLAYGQVDAETFLPIKVVSDGGDPALGKLSCKVA